MGKINLILGLIAVLGLLSLALPFVSADIGEGDFGCNMGGMMFGSYGSGMMLFSWLFSLLVLIALILLIFWLIKQIQKK